LQETILEMKPKNVWKHLYNLNQIPRCSRHEEKAAEFIIDFAKNLDLEWNTDEFGNILIRKPASTGMEDRPTAVIQGHIDMVCEKNNDTEHDFSADPIKMKIEDGWLTAEGTTLGADNGIALAMAMAVMEADDISHPPMEFLFTLDEETGLNGANALKSGFLEGKILLNIDSEEEGALYIGCAGGLNAKLSKNIDWQNADSSSKTYLLKTGGLRGGHSGLNIHEGFGNAIILTARLLKEIISKTDVKISAVNGGSKHNAIPREAESVIQISAGDYDKVSGIVKNFEKLYQEEYKFIEKDVCISLEETDAADKAFSNEFAVKLVNLLYCIPNGVMAMSHAIEGLVETSTNMAIVETTADSIEMLTSQRSSLGSAVRDTAGKVAAAGELAGFTIGYNDGYPAWEPDPDSKLLAVCKSVYKNKYGKDPDVKAIHAGLECGIIGEKYEGMEMISFGPDIEGAHSPDEKVHIQSTENVWEFLLDILKNIK